MYKKNDTVELTIEDMSVNGEGIGHANGAAFFVKGTVVGDKIIAGVTKVKKNMCYARIVDIINSSAHRSTERCPKAKPCGGCQLQALNYDKQLELKEKHIKDNLIRIGGLDEELIDSITEPIIGMDEPFFYRNKFQIPVGLDRSGDVVMGFYLSHSHDIVPIESCALSHPKIDALLPVIRRWIAENRVSIYHNAGGDSANRGGAGILRHILIRYAEATGEIMVCLIGNVRLPDSDVMVCGSSKDAKSDNFADKTENSPAGTFLRQMNKLVDELATVEGMTSVLFNENCKNTNVILGDKTHLIWGRETIRDYIGDIAFNISCNSFYQVNPTQTKKLYDKVKEYADLIGSENVWDLYCGIGTIGLYLSRYAKSVFGVEVVKQAIEDAKANAALNGITNAKFVAGRVEDIIAQGIQVTELREQTFDEKGTDLREPSPDIVIVDPPRKGCDVKCLEAILRLSPQKIIYVSCNPSTLARDLKILCDGRKDNGAGRLTGDDRPVGDGRKNADDRQACYTLTALTPVDMFPQTGHVETVCLLGNRKPDTRVKIDVDLEDYYRIKDSKKNQD